MKHPHPNQTITNGLLQKQKTKKTKNKTPQAKKIPPPMKERKKSFITHFEPRYSKECSNSHKSLYFQQYS
jgi:hypothetical protein